MMPELQVKEVEPKFWKFGGKQIRIGSLAEFIQEIYGRKAERAGDGKVKLLPGGLRLKVEKFKDGGRKWYRLIWSGRDQAWLAAEDQTEYRRKLQATAAGEVLAGRTGASFHQ